MSRQIIEYMKNNILFLDGGMGTLLQAQGMKPGELPERLNLSRPELIQSIHKQYYDAGSNVVSTNTFGANTLKFAPEELDSIIKAAVENARIAAKESSTQQEKFVALDIGPSGRLLKPFGDLDFEDAVKVFAETVKLGVKYGVDLIIIETMNDLYETKAALLAAKENSDLPVFVSNAYSEDGKLMTGASPAAVISMLEGMHADAIGINCSFGPKDLMGVIAEYIKYSSTPIIFKPNAGLPTECCGKTVFDITPTEFAETVAESIRNGVRIAGGCCGTTPEHINELTKACKDILPMPATQKNICCTSSNTHAVVFGDSPILIGERINPTGKKRFKQALIENDMDYILKEGISQQEKGVHVLDVNVGLPDIDEVQMLQNTVCELQSISNLPLQIDTSDPVAMEAALRRTNGKPMINSVNGKVECMNQIFPLVQKYGGLLVALTLDESGIPSTAEGRVEIARKILSEAKKYGLCEKDIIFDPLCMTISTDDNAALETLKALKIIKEELKCHTSLGVSNISFGLPERNNINSTFFACALDNGLSAAIMNPYSYDMMKVYFSWRSLHGLDANCGDYIDFCSKFVQETTAKEVKAVSNIQDAESPLQKAIVKGLKDEAKLVTIELLKSVSPLDIINNDIIPALDTVGIGFENKTVYLPQLLMSAEASKYAFEQIKCFMAEKKTQGETVDSTRTIIIATVHGDIHDIGKNIVRMLLENYNFNVIDLGKDVPPEIVAEAAVKYDAPIVGLSALMTTTVPAMEETIKLLRKTAPKCKVMVGGAVLNKEYANKIGADRYAKNAMEAVRYAEEVCGK